MKPQQGRTARYILWALGFPLALWLAAALADAFSGGASLSRVLARFSVCMNAPFSVRWTEDTGRFLLLAGLLYPAGAVAVESGRGNRRPGEEYGSARWGDPRAIGKKYRDGRHREKNILLTQHVALGLDGRITKRNTHQLIVGGSGAGKTRYFCLPNVMNACCSYIITDCKGEILRAVGGLFEKQGIPFTVLDLVNMRGHYNRERRLRRSCFRRLRCFTAKKNWRKRKLNEKKNKPDEAALRDAKRGHKARIGYARIVLVCLLGALLAVPAFAEGGASGPLDTINNLSDLVFQCVRAVGVIVAGYGIVQIGLAVQSHDSSQRANGFLAFFGGLLIMFAKEILDFITV